jgi:hypothetical protein
MVPTPEDRESLGAQGSQPISKRKGDPDGIGFIYLENIFPSLASVPLIQNYQSRRFL